MTYPKEACMSDINIGLVGAGTIGGGVVKVLFKQRGFFRDKLGLPIRLSRIADVNTAALAKLPIGDALCSASADDILADGDIRIVIELVGGTTFAKSLVLRALAAGKHVITANKALLAEHGPEIFAAAEKNGVSVYFEASVGGGMPAIKTIREALIGNDIRSVRTIINGTCNYILTKMQDDGLPFEEALAQAQQSGFAEADPTLDVGGGDTGHKVAILASLLYGGYVSFDKLPIEGITAITADDIAYASDLGYRIKLLGIIKEAGADGLLDVRVHPAMLHVDHILASVANVYNAVLLEGDAVGQILLYGRGAGEMPTASAVVSDIIDVARNIVNGAPKRIPMDYYSRGREIALKPLADIVSRYYLRFTVVDKPKVLAPITAVLGDNNISIASVIQRERHAEDRVPVIILTHPALERSLQASIAKIETMDFITNKTQIIRIEE
jgi:homoserine dehydrogenase